MSEKCDRCGSVGEDRRTLWMACFYSMNEYSIPFTEREINGTCVEANGKETIDFFGHPKEITAFPEHDGVESCKRQFYTLRVCKRCRGEWLAAIDNWYASVPKGQDHDADEPNPDDEPSVGSGIFIRYNGNIIEVTEEQFKKYKETGSI